MGCDAPYACFNAAYRAVAYLKTRYLRIDHDLRAQVPGRIAIGLGAGTRVHVAIPGHVQCSHDFLLPDGRSQFLNQGAIGDLCLDAQRTRMVKL